MGLCCGLSHKWGSEVKKQPVDYYLSLMRCGPYTLQLNVTTLLHAWYLSQWLKMALLPNLSPKHPHFIEGTCVNENKQCGWMVFRCCLWGVNDFQSQELHDRYTTALMCLLLFSLDDSSKTRFVCLSQNAESIKRCLRHLPSETSNEYLEKCSNT